MQPGLRWGPPHGQPQPVLCALRPAVPGAQLVSAGRGTQVHPAYLAETCGLAVCQRPATALTCCEGRRDSVAPTGLGPPGRPCGPRGTALEARTAHYSFVPPVPRTVWGTWWHSVNIGWWMNK